MRIRWSNGVHQFEGGWRVTRCHGCDRESGGQCVCESRWSCEIGSETSSKISSIAPIPTVSIGDSARCSRGVIIISPGDNCQTEKKRGLSSDRAGLDNGCCDIERNRNNRICKWKQADCNYAKNEDWNDYSRFLSYQFLPLFYASRTVTDQSEIWTRLVLFFCPVVESSASLST